MREQNRAYTLFLKWLGYRQCSIDVEADERYAGKSSYNFSRKTRMALEFVSAQSNKPLFFAIRIGFLCALLSFLFIIWLIIHYLISGDVPSGWTSMIASLYFLGGLIMMFIGIVGTYIGYIFNEVKHRPLYVIRKVINKEKKTEEHP